MITITVFTDNDYQLEISNNDNNYYFCYHLSFDNDYQLLIIILVIYTVDMIDNDYQ